MQDVTPGERESAGDFDPVWRSGSPEPRPENRQAVNAFPRGCQALTPRHFAVVSTTETEDSHGGS